MSKPAIDIKNVSVATPCMVDWELMTGDERKRFCGQCKKNVFNLSDMTEKEAENFLSTELGNGRVPCIQFFKRADGTILFEDCPVGLRRIREAARTAFRFAATALSLLLSIASAVCAPLKPDGSSNANTTKIPAKRPAQIPGKNESGSVQIPGSAGILPASKHEKVQANSKIQANVKLQATAGVNACHKGVQGIYDIIDEQMVSNGQLLNSKLCGKVEHTDFINHGVKGQAAINVVPSAGQGAWLRGDVALPPVQVVKGEAYIPPRPASLPDPRKKTAENAVKYSMQEPDSTARHSSPAASHPSPPANSFKSED